MIQENKDLIVIDVRSPEEFSQGHIEGAINIPHDQIESRLKEIDSSKPLLVYCGVGKRSAIASEILYKNNFDVYNMYEGYKTYLENDL